MKTSILLSLTLGGLALYASVTRSQNTNIYTFTSFDVPFAGASNTKAFAINARGDVVGRYVDSSAGYPKGFLRHSDGTYAPPIEVPVANTGTVARGIDSRGDIVGKYFDPANPNATHGYLIAAGGAFTSFDVNLSGAISGTTVANSINNPGQIVGQYAAPAAIPGCPGNFPLAHGFLRNTDGSFTSIDYPAGNVISTFASGIDDSGNIVGSYVTAPNPPSACGISALVTAHGFMRDSKGNYTTVDPPASSGAKESAVTRISDAGDLTGAYTTVQTTFAELLGDSPTPALGPGSGFYFVFASDGTFISIPIPFASFGRQGPLGINPRGNLAGFYSDGAGDHGFLATK